MKQQTAAVKAKRCQAVKVLSKKVDNFREKKQIPEEIEKQIYELSNDITKIQQELASLTKQSETIERDMSAKTKFGEDRLRKVKDEVKQAEFGVLEAENKLQNLNKEIRELSDKYEILKVARSTEPNVPKLTLRESEPVFDIPNPFSEVKS